MPEPTTNERIALVLGWKRLGGSAARVTLSNWRSPVGAFAQTPPDYEHDMNACLEVLAILRERGLRTVELEFYADGIRCRLHTPLTRSWITALQPTPSEALALCIAEALEAKQSPGS